MDLESLDTQPLVDPSDPSLEFIEKKDNLRPLAIFRVDTEFLLCYDGKLHSVYILFDSDSLQNGHSLWTSMASGPAVSGKPTGKGDPRHLVCLFAGQSGCGN